GSCFKRAQIESLSHDADAGSSLTQVPLAEGAPKYHRAAQSKPHPGQASPVIPLGPYLGIVLVQLEPLLFLEAQAHAIQDLPAPSDEPVPALGEEPPSGTELELVAASEPSCPCPGLAQHWPIKQLLDLMAPAVAIGLSSGAESMAGARGRREEGASMAPARISHAAVSPGHSGRHGGIDPGMWPEFLCLTGERLLSFGRAAAQQLERLLLLGLFA
uniref:Uncharacterized protein n=1 Tax=Papio anubis TaxID=9555 RepID=A0A8I5R9B8_PAPAN